MKPILLTTFAHTLQVHYEAFLEDGTRIDSTYDRNLPLKFTVGAGQVVEGWEVAIQRLCLSQKAEVTIPPLYAYGRVGCPPTIPAQATLVYRMEVLQIQ